MDTEGCPSPRVGHASLTLGNAFIVFGGDTKIEENDMLDDDLYLLNTTTLKWTVANPVGSRPSGRYGHSISTIGSKIYIFGGQLDDDFFDDLVCYDLTTLRSPNSQWQVIKPATGSPPKRTNHTVATYKDQLYLFGGTDGKLWYSDTWCYDPVDNSWTLLECSGFIPSPCEGHAATIVDDIMYVFGGRSSQGNDIGTLSALKLTTRKWFAFQNLGPGPSPRSGHSMTAFASGKVLVMGGESPEIVNNEANGLDEGEMNRTVFILDTTRINYPPDSAPTPPQAQQQFNQHQISPSPSPALQKSTSPVPPALQQQLSTPSPVLNNYQPRPELNQPHSTSTSISSLANNSSRHDSDDHTRSPSGLSELTPGVGYERVDVGPRNAIDETDNNSVLETHLEKATNNIASVKEEDDEDTLSDATPKARALSPELTTIPGAWQSSSSASERSSPVVKESISDEDPLVSARHLENGISSEEVDDQSTPRVSKLLDPQIKVDEGMLSNDEQVSNVTQALERLKASNSWYETELAAAKDAGYVPASRPPVDVLKLRRVSQRLTQDNANSLQERDILVAALSEIKEELKTVQESLKQQVSRASERISQVETQRDQAINENQELKQKLEFKGADVIDSPSLNGDNIDMSLRVKQLEHQLAETNRTKELLFGQADTENNILNIESLKSDNINLEKQLRSQTDKFILVEHEVSQLRSQFDEVRNRNKDLESVADDKVKALSAAGAALSSSQAKFEETHKQLDEHRQARSDLEVKVAQLSEQLNLHKEQSEQYQREAKEHKDLLDLANQQNEHSHLAMVDGIDRIVGLWSSSKSFKGSKGSPKTKWRSANGSTNNSNRASIITADGDSTLADDDLTRELEYDEEDDPRYAELQRRMDDVSKLHQSHKQAADKAVDDLTLALKEIAQLKQQLALSDESKTKANNEVSSSMDKIKQVQKQLEINKLELQELSQRNAQLELQFKEQHEAKSQASQQELEHLKQEHAQAIKGLDDNHNTRYNDLENEYEKSLQYFKNTETALTKTREELSKYKESNSKLQQEVDELKLRLDQEDDGQGDESTHTIDRIGSPNAGSTKYNSRHYDLQLRDLRAQIIILQEERDELRQQVLQVKKKQINSAHDLEDAQNEIQRLMQENDALMKKLNVVQNGD